MKVRLHWNVILLSVVVYAVFSIIAGVLSGHSATAGAAVLPLTGLVAGGLLNVSQIFGKRAKPLNAGKQAPPNIAALVTFLVAGAVIATGIKIGLDPFVATLTASLLEAASGGTGGAVTQTLLVLLSPLLATSVGVITSFATRDGDGDDDGDEKAVASPA